MRNHETLLVERKRVAPPGRYLPPHFHDEVVLALVRAGGSLAEIGGLRIAIRPPCLVLLPPGLFHSCSADPEGGLVYDFFSFKPGSVQSRFGIEESLPLILPLREEELEILARSFESSPQQSFLSEARLADFLHRVPGLSLPARSPSPLVDRAVELLGDRIDQPLRLKALAGAVGLSDFGLIRAFDRRFGVSPGAYRAVLRVNRAKKLLRRGVSPAETAFECGFCDQSHLSRVFGRYAGRAPGAYLRDSSNFVQDAEASSR